MGVAVGFSWTRELGVGGRAGGTRQGSARAKRMRVEIEISNQLVRRYPALSWSLEDLLTEDHDCSVRREVLVLSAGATHAEVDGEEANLLVGGVCKRNTTKCISKPNQFIICKNCF